MFEVHSFFEIDLIMKYLVDPILWFLLFDYFFLGLCWQELMATGGFKKASYISFIPKLPGNAKF